MKRILLLLSLAMVAGCTTSKTNSMSAEKNLSGYAPVNGINMYYEIYGEGEPLVLIHGGGSTIESNWGEIIPLLSKHFKVIAMELQAHGRTSDRNAPESFEQDAKDVAALLQYLKISKAHIMGFSNGGQTAMQMGISHPEVINKLILISCFYNRDGAFAGFFDFMQNVTLDNMPAPLKTAYLKVNNDQKGLETMFNRDKDRMVNFKDWRDEDLQSIKSSTFIIAGDNDVVTREHLVKMSKLIPNAQLMILPGTHGSFIGEVCTKVAGSKMPEFTAGMIEEFLKKP